MQHNVTETERWTIINGLRTAADACEQAAAACKREIGNATMPEGTERVIEQMGRQAVEYRRLAVVAEIAESAVVEYDEIELGAAMPRPVHPSTNVDHHM